MAVSSPQCGENTPFSPVFPLAGATDKAFCRLSLWNFKEKSINHFYNTAYFFIGSVIVCGCFISKALWKYSLFIQFSHWRNLELRCFAGYSFGTSRKRASTIFYNTSILKIKTRPIRHWTMQIHCAYTFATRLLPAAGRVFSTWKRSRPCRHFTYNYLKLLEIIFL